MRNPWVALDVSTDPLVHARVLSRAHERTLEQYATDPDDDSRADGQVRDMVLASWRRSLAAGVAPDAKGTSVVLDDDDLEERRARSPLAPGIDAIFDSLSTLDGDARHVVAIADAHGHLLWVRGERRAMEQARSMRFQEGALWSEAAGGTNAVGTALTLDHAVQIFSAEHLVAVAHGWTCSAAPIHDPMTGELIGVVDLSADLRTAHPHTLSLVGFAAQAAEARIREEALKRSERTRPPAPSVAQKLSLRLLGHGATATLSNGNTEHGLRSLELLAVLAMHQEGLTAEELVLSLFGERGKAVTVRAQVHRLRAKLGEATVETQPYRLGVKVWGDWIEVGRMIAAGRPSAALRAYRGPLLPASDVPAIIEARVLLEESLRRSVLTTADPTLLARWLAHAAGRDDLAAARALVAVLPAGDSRRAAATASAAAISSRLHANGEPLRYSLRW